MQPPLKLPFCSGYRQPRQIERSPIRRSLNHWPNISSTIRFPSHILFTSTLLLATSEHLCSSSRPNHPVIPSFFTHFGAPAHVSQPTAPAAIPNISNALVPTLLLHSLSRAHRERESFLSSPCSRLQPAASHIPGFARVHSRPPLNQTVLRL